DGLMFCPDVLAAVREMRRVLKPGGRCAFSVWAEPEANPLFTTLFGVLVDVMQKPPPPQDGPGPFRLAAPGALETIRKTAAFSGVTSERIAIAWKFASVAQHWEAMHDMAGPLERAAATLGAPELARLKQKIADAVAPFATADGLCIPGVALCVSGR